MLIVRNAAPGDVDAVYELASQIGPGMTTLKPDRAAIRSRLAIAAASFAGDASPGERDYLFVMEDSSNGRVAGVCAIKGAVGLDEPFYSYWLGTLVHSSREANVFSRMQALYLSYDMTGCAELCSLYLHPDYRNGLNGKLLSKSRFLFIAQFPELFSQSIFAEMRGYQAPDGSSPFWESLGRHFFQMDFQDADDLCSKDKSFIAQLMPRHPLYTTFLTEAARAAIGTTHVDTAPARRLLEQEGLRFDGYVDIFDGGPVLQARVDELRASQESVVATIEDGPCGDDRPMLISSTSMQQFRVIAVPARLHAGRLALAQECRAALGLEMNGRVRAMPLNSGANLAR